MLMKKLEILIRYNDITGIHKLLKKFITGYIPGQDVDWISNSPMHSSKIENL